MKKITFISLAAMFLLIAGCGSQSGSQSTSQTGDQSVAQTDAASTQEATSDRSVYESPDGWSVQYSPDQFEVQEDKGAVSFVYKPEAPGACLITISHVMDKMPPEVLGEVTDGWGNPDDVIRTEGFFPGTTDKWGFFRTLPASTDGSGLAQTAIAGEYNGGTLLLENMTHLSGDDETDMAISDAMASVIDSITYKDFKPQTMYDYVPGTYVAVNDEDGGKIILNEDHTGVLSFQDDIDILWGSYELIAADGSFRYEYTIEGDSLMLNYDGMWLDFQKE